MSIKIDQEKCKGCRLCATVCSQDCLSISKKTNDKGYNFSEVDNEKCITCKLCIMMCPDDCIKLDKIQNIKRSLK